MWTSSPGVFDNMGVSPDQVPDTLGDGGSACRLCLLLCDFRVIY